MLFKAVFSKLGYKIDVSCSSTSSNHPIPAKYLLPEGWAQTRGVFSHLPTKHLALASVQVKFFVNTLSPLPAVTELVTYFQWS